MTQGLHRISRCEVCGSTELAGVLDLGTHPMCDDLVRIDEDRQCREYPIEIMYCAKCATAHQRFQVPKQDLFPSTYHYRSRFTADVLNGMAQLVASCEQRLGSLAGKRILDIGCNDGSLLNFFRDRGAITLGIEPTDAVYDAANNGHSTFKAFLSEAVAEEVVTRHGTPDIITLTNVFAHIEDLSAVLRAIDRLMAPKTVLVVENHYLGAVLDGNQFDTFYHEHPRSYSYTSFVHIAGSLGRTLAGAEFPSRYGGNIRVFIGEVEGMRVPDAVHAELTERERRFDRQFEALSRNVERWRRHKREQIDQLVKAHGILRAKAFPGRAAILVKLLGISTDHIRAVHEKPGSMKIGHFLPGTRIPIVSDDELFSLPDRSKPILNLAWHISNEIRRYLQENGYSGPVVDVVEPADFTVERR